MAALATIPVAAQEIPGSGEASDVQEGEDLPPAPPGPEGERVTEPPDDFAVDRPVDGPGRFETMAVIDELSSIFGRRTGFVMAQDDHFVFPVVGLQDADTALIREHTAGLPLPVMAVDGDRSRAVMEELAVSIDGRMDGTALVSTDLTTGTITVSSADGSETSSAVVEAALEEARLAIDAGREDGTMATGIDPTDLVVRGGPRSWDLVEERNNGPVRSGRWVDDTLHCTAGFLFLTSANHFRHSFAGHCTEGTNRSVRYHNPVAEGGALVGYTERYFPNGWDFASFTLPSNYDGLPAVTVSSTGNYRRVEGSTGQGTGLQYCFAGLGIWEEDGANEKCGPLNTTVVDAGKTLHCLERRTYHGDSGGPVYALTTDGDYDAYAAGTTVAAFTDGDATPTRHFNCYNNISSILAASGYSLMIWK